MLEVRYDVFVFNALWTNEELEKLYAHAARACKDEKIIHVGLFCWDEFKPSSL